MHDVRFELSNIELCGLSNGNLGKPVVLALHGWLDNAASFLPLSKYFDDFHLIALDFAGHGLSSHRSHDAHYHQIDFVHDLHELILNQKYEKVIIVGHSMGGIVGSMYVSAFPEYVSHYVTIESFGPLTKTPQSSPTQLRESIESRLKLQARDAKHPQSIETVVKARALAGDMSTHAAQLLISRNVYEQDGELRFRTDRRLRTLSSLRVTDEQAEHFMRSIACPTLAIMGTKGYEMMREKVQHRTSWVSNLTHLSVDGGHHLHMENPEQVAGPIIEFLESQ